MIDFEKLLFYISGWGSTVCLSAPSERPQSGPTASRPAGQLVSSQQIPNPEICPKQGEGSPLFFGHQSIHSVLPTQVLSRLAHPPSPNPRRVCSRCRASPTPPLTALLSQTLRHRCVGNAITIMGFGLVRFPWLNGLGNLTRSFFILGNSFHPNLVPNLYLNLYLKFYLNLDINCHLNIMPNLHVSGDLASCSCGSEAKSWWSGSQHLPHSGGNILQGF